MSLPTAPTDLEMEPKEKKQMTDLINPPSSIPVPEDTQENYFSQPPIISNESEEYKNETGKTSQDSPDFYMNQSNAPSFTKEEASFSLSEEDLEAIDLSDYPTTVVGKRLIVEDSVQNEVASDFSASATSETLDSSAPLDSTAPPDSSSASPLHFEMGEDSASLDLATGSWNAVMTILKETLSPFIMETWFSNVVPVRMDGNIFYVATPVPMEKTIIETRFSENVCLALEKLFGSTFTLVVLDKNQLDLPRLKQENSNLYEEYNFDNFIVGESNKVAHGYAMGLAKASEAKFNPFFLYGNSGLGKTHLICAIANEKKKLFPHMTILYSSGEDWLNEFINSIQNNSQNDFKSKYRNVDLFILDDVHSLANKESTQQELFNTFDVLFRAKKQIVFTSDRPPHELNGFPARLTSRFSQGLTQQIMSPDYETCVAIIKSKASLKGVQLPAPIIEFIAENIKSNVREIEGTVNRILAFRDISGKSTYNEESVMALVKDILKNPSELVVTPEVIIQEVALFYDLRAEDLRKKGRRQNVVFARNIAIFLIRTMTEYTLTDIGKEFSGRDHATILNSLNNIEKVLNEDKKAGKSDLQLVIDDISHRIKSNYSV